jgi:hypothetical protein
VATDAFESEELGTNSRLTPLMEPPAWLRAQAIRGADLDEDAVPLRPPPSGLRRFLSVSLFVVISGGALVILALALLRVLGQPGLW